MINYIVLYQKVQMKKLLYIILFSTVIFNNYGIKKLDDLNNTLAKFQGELLGQFPIIINQLNAVRINIQNTLSELQSKKSDLTAAQKKINDAKQLIATTTQSISNEKLIPSSVSQPLLNSLQLQQKLVDQLNGVLATANTASATITGDSNNSIQKILVVQADANKLTAYLADLIQHGKDLIHKINI